MDYRSKKISVYIHRLYYGGKIKKGGMDQILDYLLANDFELLMFEFPLDYTSNRAVRISVKNKNAERIICAFNMPKIFAQANWVLETLVCTFLTFVFRSNIKYAITADPLATLPALMLRKLGFYKFVYFHAVDFSTDRFRNPLMNFFYLVLLKISLKNVDLVGVVTLPAKKRLSNYTNVPMFFIPNSPDFEAIGVYRKNIHERIKNSLVITCSDVSRKYLIHNLVELTISLKKEIPDVLLNVVGHFDDTSEYFLEMQKSIHDANAVNNIKFYGALTREENYEIISKSKVGLAFYDGNFSHVMFGDALKIREYCALGLPVVADPHTTTAVDMAQQGCGFLATNFGEAQEKIKELFLNEEIYTKCSKKSLLWAKKNDKRVLAKKLLDKFPV